MDPEGRHRTCCQRRFSKSLAPRLPSNDQQPTCRLLELRSPTQDLGWRFQLFNFCCKLIRQAVKWLLTVRWVSLTGLEVTQMARGLKRCCSCLCQRWMDLRRSLAPAAWSRCFWCQLWHVRRLILAVPVFLWSQGLVTHVNDNEGGGNTLSLEIHLYRFLSLSSNSTVVI